MTWRRTRYAIAGDAGLITVRGLANRHFGIRYEGGIGFRVTHLNSGHLIACVFFKRLRDAVAFCEEITPLTDWEAMTATGARAQRHRLVPLLSSLAGRYERFALVDGETLLRLHAEAA